MPACLLTNLPLCTPPPDHAPRRLKLKLKPKKRCVSHLVPQRALTDHTTAAHRVAEPTADRAQPPPSACATARTPTQPTLGGTTACETVGPAKRMPKHPPPWHTETQDSNRKNDPALHIFRLHSDVLGPSSTSDTARTAPVLISDTCVPLLWPTCYQRARESAHLQHNGHSKRVAPGATS